MFCSTIQIEVFETPPLSVADVEVDDAGAFVCDVIIAQIQRLDLRHAV